MSKAAKPGSLREHVETQMKEISGCENLETVLHNVREGNRADYLLSNRSIIVEQKEYEDSAEHRMKGRQMYEFTNRLIQNGLSTNAEIKETERLKSKFYNKIGQKLHHASNQIASTKKILNLPNAVGVALLISDRVPGLMPVVVDDRVCRSFDSKSSENNCPYIDVVVYSMYMKDLLSYTGKPCCNGGILRNDSDNRLLGISRLIRDGLNGKNSNRQRVTFQRNEWMVQLHPDIFRD